MMATLNCFSLVPHNHLTYCCITQPPLLCKTRLFTNFTRFLHDGMLNLTKRRFVVLAKEIHTSEVVKTSSFPLSEKASLLKFSVRHKTTGGGNNVAIHWVNKITASV